MRELVPHTRGLLKHLHKCVSVIEHGVKQIFWYRRICSVMARNLMQIINKTQQDMNKVKKALAMLKKISRRDEI